MNTRLDYSMAMAERLTANINAGKPGFMAILKKDDSMLLVTQRRMLPVTFFEMSFTDGHSRYQATKESFQEQLLVGLNSEYDNVSLVSFADDPPETVHFSSEQGLLSGSLFVVAAVEQCGEPRAWTESVVFSRGQGALYYGLDEQFAQYAQVVSRLNG